MEEGEWLVAIESGGSSSTSAIEACKKFGALSTSERNKVGGYIGLSNGCIPPAFYDRASIYRPMVDGVLTVAPGKTQVFKITNYSIDLVHTATCTNGTATILGDTILFTAPNTPGHSTLTVNGRDFNITITNPCVNAPSIINPVDGATNTGASLSISTTPFSVFGTDTHLSTDWQVATDIDFTSLTVDDQGSSDLIEHNVSGLSGNTQYFVRARHKGTALGYSQWSNTISFTTASAGGEQATLIFDDVESGSGATVVKTTTNGEYAFISSAGKDSGTGAVYIYKQTNGSWSQVQKIQEAAGGSFGWSMSVTPDGRYIAVGAVYGSAVYLYKTDAFDTWTLQHTFTADADLTDGKFGYSVAISNDGRALVVGAPYGPIGGRVCAYHSDGTTWAHIQDITSYVPLNTAMMGHSVTLSGDGLHLSIGAPAIGDATNASLHFYMYDGNQWVWKTSFNDKTLIESNGLVFTAGRAGLGKSNNVAASNDGATILAVSYSDSGGHIYVFTRDPLSGSVSFTEILKDTFFGSYSRSVGNIAITSDGGHAIIGDTNNDPETALILTRAGGHYSLTRALFPSSTTPGMMFGSVVCVSPSGNMYIVSAPQGMYNSYPNFVFV